MEGMTKAWKWPAKAREGGCSTVRTAMLAAVLAFTSFTWLKWWPVFPHEFHLSFMLYYSCFSIGNGICFWLWTVCACVQKEAFNCVSNTLLWKTCILWLGNPSFKRRVAESKSKKPPQERFRKAIDTILFVGRIQSWDVPGIIVQLLFCFGGFFGWVLCFFWGCEAINFNRYFKYQMTSDWRLVKILWKHIVIKTSSLCKRGDFNP